MNTEEIERLITKSLSEQMTDEESELLKMWLEKSEENRAFYKEMEKTWNLVSANPIRKIQTAQDGWDDLEKKLFEPNKTSQEAKILRIDYKQVIGFAATISIVVFGLLLYSERKSEKIEYFTKSGETKKITLSDGTYVYLNASSRISFIESEFNDAKREVHLDGEAFFEVNKNENKPFVVETGNSKTEVLGTKFNLRYLNNSTELRVQEGKVSFTSLNDKVENRVIVTAGYKSNCSGFFNAENPVKMEIMVADVWRKNLFIAESKTLEFLLNEVSKKYSVKFIVSNQLKSNSKKITTQYSEDNVEKIVSGLCKEFNLWYEKQDSVYTLHDLK